MLRFHIYIIGLLIFFLSSCYYKEKHLGSVPVKGMNGIFFDLYQEKNFNPNVGISYKIIDGESKLLFGPHFLVGTDKLERENTGDFYAGSYGDLVYLTYMDTCLIHVLYNSKTKVDPMDITFQQKPDSLIENELLKSKPYLKFAWRE